MNDEFKLKVDPLFKPWIFVDVNQNGPSKMNWTLFLKVLWKDDHFFSKGHIVAKTNVYNFIFRGRHW